MTLIVQEISWREPESVFRVFSKENYLVWLDSAASHDPRSRYSYICIEPFRRLQAYGSRIVLNGDHIDGDPFEVFQRELASWRIDDCDLPVPFAGGAVGFLGYELACHLEKIPQRHTVDVEMPDMAVAFYDVIIAFDAQNQRCWVLSSGFPETAPSARHSRAVMRAHTLISRIEVTNSAIPISTNVFDNFEWQSELTQNEYEEKIGRVLDYIRAGDIFQANFTMRHLVKRPKDQHAADIYMSLRKQTPAPFGAFIACGAQLSLASASPERFMKLDAKGHIETRPIKGTRPRFSDLTADIAAANELAVSEKDQAENLMIVDLLRNDIGRVSEIGSVKVPSLFQVESFASMHHLVSVVEGKLCPGLGPVDLLRATFPGGSVTGAPKLRAIEIINELEVARRGPYCGAIVWIGFNGTMDSSIIIRTLVITPEIIIAQAGGGIVADSNPKSEYYEQLAKVSPMLRTLSKDKKTS